MAVGSLIALGGLAASLATRRAQRGARDTARLGVQQQASLAQLLEDISNLLLRYGVDGRLQFAKGVEIADLDVFDFFRRSGRLACLDALEKLTPAQPGLTHEVVGVRDGDGRERIERWSHRLIVTANGAADGFVSTAQDITELRTLNEQLIQSSKLVALGEISAGIAHELMQPLNALKIGLANLRRRQASGEAETAEEAAARFDRLERQVSRAGDVVHTMRLLGRLSDLKLSPVAIDDLLEEVFQLFDRPLAVLGITLIVERPEDQLFVLAHPQFLLQVLINLLANARDALEDGTEDDADRRVHLTVSTDGGGRVQIEVRDNGPGIPPHLMDRVVEPFFTTKAPGKGMGLGLALSNRLVLLFGGTLEFGNQSAGGAFFRIGLRRAVAMESTSRQTRAGRDIQGQQTPGQGD
jgi:C4-dicarboxylate-specific signal transduction histidine kinase